MATAEDPKKSTAREYYEALLIAVIFVNFARIFVFQAFKIPTGSMEDNLKIGDHIIVNKFIYGPVPNPLEKVVPSRDIRHGDIIVFRFPQHPEQDFVKRVIGLPGDAITISNKVVAINGTPLEEPYVIHKDSTLYPPHNILPEPYHSRDNFGPYIVPPDSYFAMGDNRDYSYDSRFWGTVPRSMIKGRAFMVYWSFHNHPVSADAPVSARVHELWGVARHFLSNTRWDRTFFIVDSKYHYHPEPTLDDEESTFSP